MRLEQLQYILEVNNKKSITEAAKTFFISQPQLSHSIKNLEDQLGYKIFRRTRAGLTPTSQGQEVLALAREIINYSEEMQMLVKDTDLSGNLSLVIGPAVFNAFAAPILTHVHKVYPNVHLMITEDPGPEVIRKVEENRSILGIAGWPVDQDKTQLKLLDSKNLGYEKFVDSTFELIIGKDHPLAKKEKASITDLEEATYIDYYGLTEAFLRMSGIIPKQNPIIVYEREAFKTILASNRAVSIFPKFFSLYDIYFQEGLLLQRPIEEMNDEFKASLYLIYSNKEPLSYLTKQIIKITQSILPKNQ